MTTAGLGKPPWVFLYACITRAAAPDTNGADSLVPPASSIALGLPRLLVHSEYLVFASQEAQLRSPGATRLTVPPASLKPAELNELMLLSSQPLGAKYLAPPMLACAIAWNCVVAPTAMRFGSLDGEPMVFAVPASPVETLTTTPALTAASSKILIASAALSGSVLPPNDSLSTFTFAVSTA